MGETNRIALGSILGERIQKKFPLPGRIATQLVKLDPEARRQFLADLAEVWIHQVEGSLSQSSANPS